MCITQSFWLFSAEFQRRFRTKCLYCFLFPSRACESGLNIISRRAGTVTMGKEELRYSDADCKSMHCKHPRISDPMTRELSMHLVGLSQKNTHGFACIASEFTVIFF